MGVPCRPFVGGAKRRLRAKARRAMNPLLLASKNGAVARDRDQPLRVGADTMDGAAKAAMWKACWSAA